jgi:HSP20 family molecular chaperone IbpA
MTDTPRHPTGPGVPPEPAPPASEPKTGSLPIQRPGASTQGPPNRPASAAADQSERMLFTPPIDIYETDEGLVLHADLPGVSVETLELQVQDNKLTLFGRVTLPAPPEAKLVHGEYHVGDFLRSFILSDEVDHDRITASMTGGVLRVVLPKSQKAEPRRIRVQTD